MYHLLLAMMLIGVKSSSESRAVIQDGYWPVKLLALATLSVVSFFIPNKFFQYYGWVSLGGAAFFILIQLVLLIEFAYSINQRWVEKLEDEGHITNRYYVLLIVFTFGSIILALALSIVMLVLWSKTSQLNQFFIVFNMALSFIIGVLSINERIREHRPSSGLLQSGVVMFYAAYLVFSAIMSEPAMTGDPKTPQIVIGAVFTIISVCYSAFRASDSNDVLGRSDSGSSYSSLPTINSSSVQDDDDGEGHIMGSEMDDDEKDGVAYNYSFFHITFALGAMYIGMLLTNWSTISGLDNNGNLNVDSGMVSVWVKIVSCWCVHILYFWTLVGPTLFPNRVWD
ncbi:hypothetical protein SAMD00019534_121860, partial [Acytostelium subglobosum LB1]|uniref:hypothetical protein n=1 Tax=Acytostelium subglobosum LB1 TaxID=1410327 RepID=UPI000644B3EC